jgi:hypothetical protein
MHGYALTWPDNLLYNTLSFTPRDTSHTRGFCWIINANPSCPESRGSGMLFRHISAGRSAGEGLKMQQAPRHIRVMASFSNYESNAMWIPFVMDKPQDVVSDITRTQHMMHEVSCFFSYLNLGSSH